MGKTLLVVVQDALAILVTLGVLLQTPKASGLGGTIGGGGGDGGGGGYRRRRGLEASLLKATSVLIVLFVGASVVSTYVGTR